MSLVSCFARACLGEPNESTVPAITTASSSTACAWRPECRPGGTLISTAASWVFDHPRVTVCCGVAAVGIVVVGSERQNPFERHDTRDRAS
jgi:hypothetical protein